MCQWLTEQLGQPVIIDNRPGASSNIATQLVVRSPADGYTLLSVNSSNLINATLYEKLPHTFLHDIDLIASFGRVALVIEVIPSFPARTLPEFIPIREDQHGLRWNGKLDSRDGRAVQDNDRRRFAARAISRLPRSHGWRRRLLLDERPCSLRRPPSSRNLLIMFAGIWPALSWSLVSGREL
jgi:hypothetical protein